jgi:hypothetical protein
LYINVLDMAKYWVILLAVKQRGIAEAILVLDFIIIHWSFHQDGLPHDSHFSLPPIKTSLGSKSTLLYSLLYIILHLVSPPSCWSSQWSFICHLHFWCYQRSPLVIMHNSCNLNNFSFNVSTFGSCLLA